MYYGLRENKEERIELRQNFEKSYSRDANKNDITGVYIKINNSYRKVNLEMQVSKVKFIIKK
jgi:hypothetical protein